MNEYESFNVDVRYTRVDASASSLLWLSRTALEQVPRIVVQQGEGDSPEDRRTLNNNASTNVAPGINAAGAGGGGGNEMEEIDSDQDEPTGLEGAAFQSRLPYDKLTAQEGAGE